MPRLESHLETVGGARYITVCDVQKRISPNASGSQQAG